MKYKIIINVLQLFTNLYEGYRLSEGAASVLRVDYVK